MSTIRHGTCFLLISLLACVGSGGAPREPGDPSDPLRDAAPATVRTEPEMSSERGLDAANAAGSGGDGSAGPGMTGLGDGRDADGGTADTDDGGAGVADAGDIGARVTDDVCPAPVNLMASAGTRCDPEGRVCEYASSSRCGSNLRCIGGTWSVETACSPEQECAPVVPEDGAPCVLEYPPSGPLYCNYDSCPTARQLAVCDGSTWNVTDSPCST